MRTFAAISRKHDRLAPVMQPIGNMVSWLKKSTMFAPIALLVGAVSCSDLPHGESDGEGAGEPMGDPSRAATERSGAAEGQANNVAVETLRKAQDGEWPAVGMLTRAGSLFGAVTVELACSGALIQTEKYKTLNVVLTAKHCGNELKQFYLGTGKSLDTRERTFERDLLCRQKRVAFDVLSAVPIGNGKWGDKNWTSGNKVDVELLLLNYAPEGVTPLTLKQPSQKKLFQRSRPLPYKTGMSIGFGIVEYKRFFYQGQKTLVPMSFDADQPYANAYTSTVIVPEDAATTGIWKPRVAMLPDSGDSGGPLVGTAVAADNTLQSEQVVGVVSEVTKVARAGEKYNAYYARTDTKDVFKAIETQLAEWIKTTPTLSPGKRCSDYDKVDAGSGAPPTPANPGDPTRLGIR